MRLTTSLRLDDATIDLRSGVVVRDRGEARLTARELDLLRYLQARAHRVVPREELMREVWEYSDSTRSRAVDFTVHRLRTKIEVDPTDPRHLVTAHGVGYQLVLAEPAPTTEVPTGQVTFVAVLYADADADIDADSAAETESDASLGISERVVALAEAHGGHAARGDGREWLVAFGCGAQAIRAARALIQDPVVPAGRLAIGVVTGCARCVREPVSGRWDYRGPVVERAIALARATPVGRLIAEASVADGELGRHVAVGRFRIAGEPTQLVELVLDPVAPAAVPRALRLGYPRPLELVDGRDEGAAGWARRARGRRD